MNEHAIQHVPDSKYCFPIGEKEIILRLRVAKDEPIEAISVIYACKYQFSLLRKTADLSKQYSDRLYDYYEIRLLLEDVRFTYVFKIAAEDGTYYFSEDGLTKEYDFKLGFYNFFQLPYINPVDLIETVEWMRSAVFYQIFVDRFYQGDAAKDTAYINCRWGEIPNPRSFTGGDLKGILTKLGYIKGLGANTIYLTPLFKSISNHKYDTIDYYTIDQQFGTNEDFKELVDTAHKNGIRIVLDAVFNHCSNQCFQFQDVLEKGKASPYHDWFLIDGDQPNTKDLNYECFASCEYMPKINTSNEEARKFLLDIAVYWIKEYDIDGWRLDVSDEISHDFWRVFRKAVKKAKKDCVIIGENWHDAYPFLMGDQYDGIMNYAFTKANLDYFAFDTFNSKGFSEKLNEILMRNKQQINEMMLNLLDSHDTHRFFTQINKDKDKLLAALAIEILFIGAPSIYYGTELCMEGGYDPDCRRTLDWSEENWDKRFLSLFKALTALKQNDILQYGEIAIKSDGDIFIMERIYLNKKIVFLYNRETKACSLNKAKKLMGTNTAEILTSNRYQNEQLETGGYIIVQIDR